MISSQVKHIWNQYTNGKVYSLTNRTGRTVSTMLLVAMMKDKMGQ